MTVEMKQLKMEKCSGDVAKGWLQKRGLMSPRLASYFASIAIYELVIFQTYYKIVPRT